MARLYQAGATIKDLAKKSGRCDQSVRKAIRAEGVELRPGRSLTQILELEAVRRYQSHESSPKIARELGIDRGTVLRVLRRRGVAIRSRSAARTTLTPKDRR